MVLARIVPTRHVGPTAPTIIVFIGNLAAFTDLGA